MTVRVPIGIPSPVTENGSSASLKRSRPGGFARQRAARAAAAALWQYLACLNCGNTVSAPRKPWSLYCSAYCQFFAEAVRYRRKVERDGRWLRSDIQEAVAIQQALLFTGHTRSAADQSRRPLTKAERASVFGRRRNDCADCGEPATDIDHIDPYAGNGLDNLQPLCQQCHRIKTLSSRAPLPSDDPAFPGREAAEKIYRRRTKAKRPILPCDDDVNWTSSWLAIQRARHAEATAPALVGPRGRV